jgi:hypothetical protein
VVRYRIDPEESRVWIEARSSVHPINGQAGGLTGHVDVDVRDGRLDLGKQPEMHVELPVERLGSGNPLYDRELQRRIDARRHPTITGTTRSVTALEVPGWYAVRGDVSFYGAVRAVDGEIHLGLLDGGALQITGERVFDVREFGLEPPRLLMLKVYPEVMVRILVVAHPEPTPGS